MIYKRYLQRGAFWFSISDKKLRRDFKGQSIKSIKEYLIDNPNKVIRNLSAEYKWEE